jgi:thiol-disulfide isomerase/thioredoxin
MKKYLLILMVLLTIVGCTKQPAQDEQAQEQAQEEQVINDEEATASNYIDITGMTLEGTELSLSEMVGQSDYVLLDFWASWCGPCRRFIPVLRDYYSRFGGDRLEILSCSVDQDERAWREAMNEERLPWQQIREDANHLCSDKYNVQFIPHTVLIDRHGHIVGVNLEEPELEAILLGN